MRNWPLPKGIRENKKEAKRLPRRTTSTDNNSGFDPNQGRKVFQLVTKCNKHQTDQTVISRELTAKSSIKW